MVNSLGYLVTDGKSKACFIVASVNSAVPSPGSFTGKKGFLREKLVALLLCVIWRTMYGTLDDKCRNAEGTTKDPHSFQQRTEEVFELSINS